MTTPPFDRQSGGTVRTALLPSATRPDPSQITKSALNGRSTGWRATGLVHDSSLLLWTALAIARAGGCGRAGALDAAVIATNLAAGTPFAIRRLRDRRTDVVAMLSPIAVVAAVLSTARGGWSPIAATAALQLLRWVDRRHELSMAMGTRCVAGPTTEGMPGVSQTHSSAF